MLHKLREVRSVAILLLVSMAGLGTCFSSTISVTGSGAINQTGDTVAVQLAISGLSKATGDSLGGFDVNLLFDPSALQFKSASVVDGASGLNQLQFTEAGAFSFSGDASLLASNTLDAYGVSGNSASVLDSQQADAFQFLVVSFASLNGLGTSVSLDLFDPNLLFLSSTNDILSPTYSNSGVSFAGGGSVSPVPEPGAITLVAFGMGACLLWSLQQRRAGWSRRR